MLHDNEHSCFNYTRSTSTRLRVPYTQVSIDLLPLQRGLFFVKLFIPEIVAK